jgi:hypothetical protein
MINERMINERMINERMIPGENNELFPQLGLDVSTFEKCGIRREVGSCSHDTHYASAYRSIVTTQKDNNDSSKTKQNL